MIKVKEILERYRDKRGTMKEQVLVRLVICLLAVLLLVMISPILDFLIWLRPYVEIIVYAWALLLAVYEGGCILWYLEVWVYGGVDNNLKQYYPDIQNAIFMVVTDIHTALGVMKPSSKSAVSSIGQKTFVKGNWVIYQYNMLLLDSSDEIDVNDAKEILQNELIRKSEEGFDGINFDINGYPYLQVDSVLVDGSYLQVQMVILWNEAQKNTYEAEQEQKQGIHSNCVTVDDEVF